MLNVNKLISNLKGNYYLFRPKSKNKCPRLECSLIAAFVKPESL